MHLESLASLPLCRRSVLELARSLPADLPLSQLAEKRDAHSFVLLSLAAAQAKRPIPAEVLVSGASLLADPLYVAVVMASMDGDVAEACVATMKDGRLIDPWVAASMLFLGTVWCQQHKRPIPSGIRHWTRFMARRADGDDILVLCIATGRLLGDEGILELLAGLDDPALEALREQTTTWLLAAFVGEAADVVPELAVAARRVGPKVGRNEACPCGSGKKYKRCCVSKPVALQGPVVRTGADVDALSAAELLALDLAPLQPSLRLAAVWGLAQLGEVARVRAALPLIPEELGFEVLASLALSRLACGDLKQAQELVEGLPPDVMPPEVLVSGLTPSKAVKVLESLAQEGLEHSPVDAALAALRSPFPALGVLVARGVVGDPEIPDEEALLVLEEIHAVRDALGMPPWDVASSWRQGADTGRIAVDREALEKVRLELASQGAARRQAEAAFDRAERERARLEGEAARAKTAAMSTPAMSEGAQEVAAVRAELQALKGIHKAVHDERNALRREVAEWRAQADEEPVPDNVDEVEVQVDDGLEDAPSGLRVPELPDGFLEHLQRLPPSTGRGVLVRIGELCSGRPTGWRETKPLQAYSNLWRAKVGRSYRMLFRVHEGRIEVIDVVHRQDFDKRLQSLR